MRKRKVSGAWAGILFMGAVVAFAACGTTAVVPAGDASVPPTPTGTATTVPGQDSSVPDAASPEGGPGADAGLDANVTDANVIDANVTDASADGNVTDATADSGPVVPPAVRLVGRWDKRSAAGPRVAYPGARIIARFTGPSVSVTMNNTTGFSGGPSRYDVFIDNVLVATQLVTITGVQTYPLAGGLPAGVHTVELVKRTEGNLGVTTFMGFDFGAGGALLSPPPASPKRIEFISDSTIDGYGVEGMGPTCPAGTLEASHSARAGLAGLVTSDLAADAIQVAYSGKGLWQNSYRPDTDTMGVLYPRTLPDDATSTWSFSEFVPEVVVISLGGSDYSKESAIDDPAPVAQFTAKYDELITMVRTYYPNAHVFMTIYAQIKDVYPLNYNARSSLRTAIQTVIANRPADTRLYLHEMAESVPSQETGCQYHGSPALHRSLANALVPVIRAKTGW